MTNETTSATGPVRYLTYAELRPLGIHYSRKHLIDLQRRQLFPQARQLSPNRIGWVESEIIGYLQSRPPARSALFRATKAAALMLAMMMTVAAQASIASPGGWNCTVPVALFWTAPEPRGLASARDVRHRRSSRWAYTSVAAAGVREQSVKLQVRSSRTRVPETGDDPITEAVAANLGRDAHGGGLNGGPVTSANSQKM